MSASDMFLNRQNLTYQMMAGLHSQVVTGTHSIPAPAGPVAAWLGLPSVLLPLLGAFHRGCPFGGFGIGELQRFRAAAEVLGLALPDERPCHGLHHAACSQCPAFGIVSIIAF